MYLQLFIGLYDFNFQFSVKARDLSVAIHICITLIFFKYSVTFYIFMTSRKLAYILFYTV